MAPDASHYRHTTEADPDALARVAERFAVRVTPHLDDAMATAATAEERAALARQFVPSAAELETTAEERVDPIGDTVHSPVPGIVHRYPDRVLLMPVDVCAAYCRFCFRRAVVGQGDGLLADEDLDRAIAYIESRPEVWEVILTGGDPLVLSPRRLAALIARLDGIPHVGVIRLHSRLPVHDPDRVTPDLVAPLSNTTDSAVWLAVHANHAAEFTPAVRAALKRLSGAGIPLVGQTVLLKGVNDSVEALTHLFRAMVRNRIKPYYLHHPDLAEGTSHFRLSLGEGRRLVKGLRGVVSGLCQPTYVLDIPGGHGKVPVGPDALHAEPDHTGATIVDDPWGRSHRYPPATDGGA